MDPTPVLTEKRRLKALHDTALLDSPSEAAFDRLTHLVTTVLGVPTAAVSLVDERRQFFKSCVGVTAPWARHGTPLSHSFCQYVVAESKPLVIEDARVHPLLRHNLAITELDVVAYAGIPLVTSDGFALGSLCAIDSQPRHWSERDISVLTDLAAAAMTEIELRAARRITEDAVRAQTEFIHRVSHELRTPLNSILGFARVLRHRPRTPLTRRDALFVERIERSGTHLLDLVNDLLDLARAEERALEVAHGDYDVAGLVQESVDLAAGAARPGVTLEARVPADLQMLRTDSRKLRQVLVNLIGNALKFTEAGSVTVAVHADAARRAIRIDVADTGPGIDVAEQERIFEPFVQSNGGSSANHAGTGLGLAICRAFCDALRYRLTLDSAPGRGSTFTIHLTP